MSGDKLGVDEATISAISGRLRMAADELGSAGHPPSALKAGRLTPVFAALGAQLSEETSTLIGQLGGGAEAVTSAGESFAEVDESAKQRLRPAYEKPGWDPGPLPPGAV